MEIKQFGQHYGVPGSRFHDHPHWELIYNLDGEGENLCSDRSDPFCKGTIVLQRPGIAHAKQAEMPFSDMFLQMERLPIRTLDAGLDPVYVFQDTVEQDFQQLMQIAYRYYTNSPRSDCLIDTLYDAMMQLIVNWMKETDVCQTPEIQWLKDTIRAKYADPELNLTLLLQQVNYNEFYLRKLFKAEVGESPGEYLRRVRIDKAKQILEANIHSGLKTKEVAQMVGFYDAHYFNRVFKAEMGMSPKEYMQSIKQGA